MLGENDTKELQRISTMKIFTESELQLVDFVITNKRIPNYVDERRLYQVLLRLKKKLKVAKEKVLILSNLFDEIDKVKVSNKLVGRGVD